MNAERQHDAGGEGSDEMVDQNDVADAEQRAYLATLAVQGEALVQAVREWASEAGAAVATHNDRLRILEVDEMRAEEISAATGAQELARIVGTIGEATAAFDRTR